jgi:nucleotide-binding universal stress UspA family protein
MIVVGVDGSESSLAALEWAFAEAKLRGSDLRAVHTWSYPLYVGGHAYVAADVMDADALHGAAVEVLESAVRDVLGDVNEFELEQVVLQGPAARTLIDQAKRAELLVVGSRGRGGFTGLMLGSVSGQCAHHAHCPVVIVRPQPPVA